MNSRTSARKARQKTRRENPGCIGRGRALADISLLQFTWGFSRWISRWLVCENGTYYYENKSFNCRDCGIYCVWRAKDQKWWYEDMRGSFESVAVRCSACRIKERERKAEARRVSEEGKRRKQAIAAFVEREEKREAIRQECLAAHEHYQHTGLHVNHSEVKTWISQLRRNKKAKAPKCHT